MRETNSTWVTWDGTKMYRKEWLPDTDPKAVILLVHGLGEHINRYNHVGAHLAGSGFAVIGIDQRGHGQTPGKRGHGSYEMTTKDLEKLFADVQQDFPGLPIVIYGHSMGGSIALYYLITRKPLIHAAVITAPGLQPAQDPGGKILLARILAKAAPSFTLPNGLERAALSRDTSVPEKYSADPLVTEQISTQLGLDLIDKGKWIIDHASELPDAPVLLMVGSTDRIVSIGALLDFARNAGNKVTYHCWNGLYHELHNEPEKEEVLKMISTWLELSVGQVSAKAA